MNKENTDLVSESFADTAGEFGWSRLETPQQKLEFLLTRGANLVSGFNEVAKPNEDLEILKSVTPNIVEVIASWRQSCQQVVATLFDTLQKVQSGSQQVAPKLVTKRTRVAKAHFDVSHKCLALISDRLAGVHLLRGVFTDPRQCAHAIGTAYQQGFLSGDRVQKRIDAAKTLDLPIDYFFSGVLAERGLPYESQISEAAAEVRNARNVSEELSRQLKKPLFVVFNARGGLLFEYGIDEIDTQLVAQLEPVARRKKTTIASLIDAFHREAARSPHWPSGKEDKGKSKSMAYLEVGQRWINSGDIEYLVISEIDTKVSSSDGQTTLSENSTTVFNSGFPVLFIDGSRGQSPRSFEYYRRRRKRTEISQIDREIGGTDIPLRDFIASFLKNEDTNGVFTATFNPHIRSGLWWDDNPVLLGERGKRFERNDHIPLDNYVVQNAQGQGEFIAEKIRMAVRCAQLDPLGRNWYERSYLAAMIHAGAAWANPRSSLGTIRKSPGFADFVPYRVTKAGEPIIDKRGYPIPKGDVVERGQANAILRARRDLAEKESLLEPPLDIEARLG